MEPGRTGEEKVTWTKIEDTLIMIIVEPIIRIIRQENPDRVIICRGGVKELGQKEKKDRT